MIADSIAKLQTSDWKTELGQSFKSIKPLLKYCQINESDLELPTTDSPFPLKVTPSYAALIEKGNPKDPLLLQILPQAQELLPQPGYSQDVVGDLNSMKVPGLLHKYHGRLLLTLTGACAIHCRYCFRQHFPYSDAVSDIRPDGAVADYLREQIDVTEVILSGGDPLMVSDQKLQGLIQMLTKFKHIKTLRIHTRLVTSLPSRITPQLINTLKQFPGRIVVVLHCNHSHELSAQNATAIQRLHQADFTLLNQSVLLKGINDRVEILEDLSHKLFHLNIMPYYLHCLDKVAGSQHFDLSKKIATGLHRELSNRLPGYLVPKLVQEISGQKSKIPVH